MGDADLATAERHPVFRGCLRSGVSSVSCRRVSNLKCAGWLPH